jgi:outer membrane protein
MSFRTAIRPLVACSALWVVAPFAHSQTKIAIVDIQRAVFESAEIKKAQVDMDATFKPRQQAAERLNQELAEISQKLNTGAGKLSDQQAADLQAEGQAKQRQLTRMNEDLQADAKRFSDEILSKTSAKMTEVVKKLAEEKGYDVVVERSTALYFKPTLDITGEAVAAYDKAYPAAAPAPPPAAKK